MEIDIVGMRLGIFRFELRDECDDDDCAGIHTQRRLFTILASSAFPARVCKIARRHLSPFPMSSESMFVYRAKRAE